MSRLPTVGSDGGTWGTVLNDFLLVSHNNDGTLKSGIVTSTQLASGAVTSANLATGAVTSRAIAAGAVTTPAIGSGSAVNKSPLLANGGGGAAWGAYTKTAIGWTAVSGWNLNTSETFHCQWGPVHYVHIYLFNTSAYTSTAGNYLLVGTVGSADRSTHEVSGPWHSGLYRIFGGSAVLAPDGKVYLVSNVSVSEDANSNHILVFNWIDDPV